MRVVGIVLGGAVAIMLLVALLIRQVDHDAETWHIDPLTGATTASNAHVLMPAGSGIVTDAIAPEFDRPVDQLAADFDDIAQGSSRVEIVAGAAEDGFVTYVQTSWFFAFPDYVSVRFIEIDDSTSTLPVFSRSRFGQSDLGVNERRITDWLEQLD